MRYIHPLNKTHFHYRVKLGILLGIFVSLMALFFYVTIGHAVLEGEVAFQFYADSLTYEELYYSGYFDTFLSMVGLGGNYLGPILILDLFDGNRFLILLFNCLVFLVSLKLIFVKANARSALLVLVLLLNPLTFFSLISVNKEIISLLVCALLVRWIYSRALWTFVAALLVAFLVRWQLAVFVVFAVLSFPCLRLIKGRRLLYISLCLLAVSLVYYKIGYLFENVNAVAQAGASSNQGSGLFSIFNKIQGQGFYFLVFIPKTLHAMFGLISNASGVFNPSSFYNDVVITINAIVSFGVFCLVFAFGRFKLTNDLVFVAILYCIIFSLSPIYAPRYFYPFFVFMAMVLSQYSDRCKIYRADA